jgi:hypothetical protein
MAVTMTSAEVRSKLIDALKLDLVGPDSSPAQPQGCELGDPDEILPQSPSPSTMLTSTRPAKQAPMTRSPRTASPPSRSTCPVRSG